MARPPVELSVDERQFAALLGKVSALEPRIKRNLRKEIRGEGEKAAADSRAEVQKPPETRAARPRSTGVRAGIAKGIKVQIATGRLPGVRIRSTGSGLPAERRRLVRLWNKPGGWRHPVFGTGAWAEQTGRPYFGSVIAKHKEQVAAGVKRALDDAARTL